jgi:hypothetical protein
MIKPGCSWADMHRLAWRVQMQHLLDMGVLTGDLDALIEARVPELFMACGLGAPRAGDKTADPRACHRLPTLVFRLEGLTQAKGDTVEGRPGRPARLTCPTRA